MIVDYYQKYLKYKNKYLQLQKLHGGAPGEHTYTIPSTMTGTLSWLYVPLIYNSLDDVRVTLPPNFMKVFESVTSRFSTKIKTFEEFKEKMKKSLNDRRIRRKNDLKNLTDDGYGWHLRAEEQERIIGMGDIGHIITVLAPQLVKSAKNEVFTMTLV